ncbi:hypothetical protein CSW64_11405 [Caulobacter mirabilis]|uniref:HTH crp-type domain-containing protein n=1 Tax=Caulobacter mirabilis TaxID=69666 RepID=A0A2D2AYA7_9CAUL|nr:hypothetical protein CSW64_11405 [Caulobacter mirabilis]
MDPVVRKLNKLHALSGSDIDEIHRCSLRRQHYHHDAQICREGERFVCRAVLSGWVAQVRELPDGRRQIFSFLLPGDLIGMRRSSQAHSSLIAMTEVVTADITPLCERVGDGRSSMALQKACGRAEEMEERILLNHIVRLGRQTASQRLAHILLEIGERLAMADQADPCDYTLPITQENLADALGLSLVHINRTIQTLRREQLMHLHGRHVVLLRPERLASLAGFTPIEEQGARSSPRAEPRSWVN